MNRFVAASFALTMFFTLAIGQEKPSGLMTDLIEQSERVWIDGMPTNVLVGENGLKTIDRQCAKVYSSRPSFSWIVPGKGHQTGWRILLSETADFSKTLWDSGERMGSESSSVMYDGEELGADKTYYWKVKVTTDDPAESDWSDVKVFQTAPAMEVFANASLPIVKTQESPISSGKTPLGNFLYDFGKDAFSQLELSISAAKSGDTVLVHLGERTTDKGILRNPTTTVRYQCYPLVLMAGTHTYRIHFKADKRNTGKDAVKMPEYIGEVVPLRYCEVEGCKDGVSVIGVQRFNVHYPFNWEASSFSCNNAVLGRVWDLCKYSVQATSFTGKYIDGDRERIPYEADALINQLCHYGADRDFLMARNSLEHLLEHPTWPTEWILQTVMIAWNDYMFTGDDRLLRKHYNLLKNHCLLALQEPNKLISTKTGKQTPDFLRSINRKEEIRDIVDWPQKVPMVDGLTGGSDGFVFTDYNSVVNATFYKDLVLMGKIAKVVDNEDDAKMFASEAENVRKAYVAAFFDKKNRRFTDGIGTDHASLHSNIYALLYGLVPEKYKDDVADYVVGKGMSCSVFTAQFLLEALYESGRADAALALMSSTSKVSWQNMIDVGSTISLEAWDDMFKPNQDWNHIWGAAPGNIIPFKMFGVAPLEPGFALVQIKPQTASLEDASILIPTIKGEIGVSISSRVGEYSLTFKTPANVDSKVSVPAPSAKEYAVMLDGKALKNTKNENGFLQIGTLCPGEHIVEIKY